MKKNIAIFQPDLNIGGIQKSLVNLLNKIDYKQYNVDLYLFKDGDFLQFINKKVNIKYLKRNSFLKIMGLKALYKLSKKKHHLNYDVAIDFSGKNTLMTLETLKVQANKKVIWVHNDLYGKKSNEMVYKVTSVFNKDKYNYFDQIICVSEGAKNGFLKLYDLESKVSVIENYIDCENVLELSNKKIKFNIDEEKTNFVFIGKLNFQKGLDLLLPIYNEVRKKRSDIHLYIIGNGPQFANVENQIKLLKLEEYVTMLGSISNIYPYLNKMDALISNSRYEGDGMTLLEAHCLGLDVIFPNYLEKYCSELKGTKDLYSSMLEQTKTKKKVNRLTKYNNRIEKKYEKLFK